MSVFGGTHVNCSKKKSTNLEKFYILLLRITWKWQWHFNREILGMEWTRGWGEKGYFKSSSVPVTNAATTSHIQGSRLYKTDPRDSSPSVLFSWRAPRLEDNHAAQAELVFSFRFLSLRDGWSKHQVEAGEAMLTKEREEKDQLTSLAL